MHFHILQHVPFEGLGSISSWLDREHAQVTYTKFFESAALPQLADIDAVIALGGPMSVNDEADLPWLKTEKQFLAQVIHAGKPVLGICLGAQLMASSLGARVAPCANKEIGWFPVVACEHGPAQFHFPATTTVFHWHGETFDLPAGATLLARSEACRQQAFQIGARAIGLQFHLETTPDSADSIITHCAHELVPAKCIQSENTLRSAPISSYGAINQLMVEVLNYITRASGGPPRNLLSR